MDIIIKTIPHEKQRYKTIGDWIFHANILVINVSDLGDTKLNCLIAIHELVEALLCRFNEPEITGNEVDKFDLANPELEEPGEDSRAPYHLQHIVANTIEKLIAAQLKVDWSEYEKKIKEL